MKPETSALCPGMRRFASPLFNDNPQDLVETVARALLGSPNQRLSSAKELRFGRRGGIVMNLERAVWYSFEMGTGGGVLDLVTKFTNLSPPEAKVWLRRHFHSDLNFRRRSRQESGRIRPPALASHLEHYWRDVWLRCRPLTESSAAGAYLAARGCRLPHADGDLRWAPKMKHPSGWIGPALVALITDARTGEPMSLHRTWIDPAGTADKAPLTRSRLLLKNHRMAGGCIRLWPDAEVTDSLALAEGIENALAAARAFQPVWAAIDAGNLAGFPVLHGLECLTIIADHDRRQPKTGRRPGLDAALKLAGRYVQAGVDPSAVRIWLSKVEGQDFADFAMGIIR